MSNLTNKIARIDERIKARNERPISIIDEPVPISVEFEKETRKTREF